MVQDKSIFTDLLKNFNTSSPPESSSGIGSSPTTCPSNPLQLPENTSKFLQNINLNSSSTNLLSTLNCSTNNLGNSHNLVQNPSPSQTLNQIKTLETHSNSLVQTPQTNSCNLVNNKTNIDHVLSLTQPKTLNKLESIKTPSNTASHNSSSTAHVSNTLLVKQFFEKGDISSFLNTSRHTSHDSNFDHDMMKNIGIG